MTSRIVQEDLGLQKVFSTCSAMEAIWRPTTTHDLGIDGQIEFLEPGTSISTGRLVAVQVKSGPSYFEKKDAECVLFYPKEQHRTYWARLSLSVILVLHNPDDDLTIYARVKPQLMTGGPLRIPITNRFTPGARRDLLDAAQNDVRMVSPDEVLADLKKARCQVGAGRVIDGVHLLLASVPPGQQHLEIRMCRLTVLLDWASAEFGTFSIGTEEYDFLLRFVMKVLRHSLTEPFTDAFEDSWYEQHLVPTIAAPLTVTGRLVLEHLSRRIGDYLDVTTFPDGISDPAQLAAAISTLAQAEADQAEAYLRLSAT